MGTYSIKDTIKLISLCSSGISINILMSCNVLYGLNPRSVLEDSA